MKKPIYLLVVFCLMNSISVCSQSLLELEKSLSGTSDAVEKISLLKQLVDSTFNTDMARAKHYISLVLEIAAKSDQDEVIAEANLLAGQTWTNLISFDSATYFLEVAKEAFGKLGKPLKVAESTYIQGSIAAHQQEFSTASERYYEAIKTYESEAYPSGVAEVYGSLSNLFYMQDDYPQAIDYGNRAIAILEKLDEPKKLASVHDDMATNYIFLEKYEESLGHIEKALALEKATGAQPFDLAPYINTRGNILKNMGRYEEALKDYQSNLDLCKIVNSKQGEMVSLANVGHTLLLKGQYAEALPILLQAIDMMKEMGNLRNLWENYMHTSNCYAALGDYKKANEYAWLYADETERQHKEEVTQLKSELTQKYETEKKEATIAQQGARIEQQTTTQWLIGGVAGLLAVVLMLLFRGFRQKQQSNALLAATNEQLEKKNEENELLLKEIHHRVKNNLQTISSLLNLQSASIKDATALKTVKESQNRVRSMALIHQKLYQGEKLVAVEMKDYFETMGEAMIESFGTRAEKVSLEISMDKLELDVDTAIPLGLITNELLTNSLKYAFPDKRQGKIEISLTSESKEEFCLKIKDNGVGRSAKKDESLPAGTGFGGRLVQLLTMQLGGKMEHKEENGTATIIRFKPLAKAA